MCASRVLAHAVAGALTMLGAAPAVRAAEPCAAWPGEMSPLPAVDGSDTFAARWAQLRVAELAALASRVAAVDPSAAYRMWQHASCLAPNDARVEEALAQLAPIQEVVPAVARAERAVASPPTSERREATQFGAVDRLMAEAAAALAQARFRDVIDARDRARNMLDALGTSNEVRRRRARLEVMAGTAELALDMEDDAERSLRRALLADRSLVLDESTPPKVRRLFLAVRAALQRAQP